MRSFKSNENVLKKEGGSYYVGSANKASSLTKSAQNETDIRIEDVAVKAIIPSVEDQTLLLNELTFMIAWLVIQNVEQVGYFLVNIYPKHLLHKYSDFAGETCKQICFMNLYKLQSVILETARPVCLKHNWATARKKQQNDGFPAKTDQPGHSPSLIRAFPVLIKKAWIFCYPFRA